MTKRDTWKDVRSERSSAIDDKLAQLDLFEQISVPHIENDRYSSPDECLENHDRFPAFATPQFSSGGKESVVLRDRRDCVRFVGNLRPAIDEVR